MRVSRKVQSQSIRQSHSKVEANQSFQQIVRTKTNELQKQEIEYLMDEITSQGDKLARFKHFQDLVKFKRLVKTFLEKTVYSGYELKSSYHFHFGEQGQKLAIVEKIDEKLIQLTEQMMNQEQKNVDLLAIIGEIKGLLINIYM